MSEYHYFNTLNNDVSTTTLINFCQTIGPMSMCRAVTIADQPGCKFREDATNRECCMHYRDDLDGACDSSWAQSGIEKPKEEK